jgi:acyl carrier protein
MTEPDIRKIFEEELARIAPDIDPAGIDPRGDLREECDIDSLDVLNLIAALHQRLGVEIPELDYPRLMTLDGALAYLQEKRAADA